MFEWLEVESHDSASSRAPDDVTDPPPSFEESLVAEIVGLERAKAKIEARVMALTADLGDRATWWVDPDESRFADPLGAAAIAACELAPALHLAPVTAGIRVQRAQRIRDWLPATLSVMAQGDLDMGRVFAIDEATQFLSPQAAARVEQLVLPKAVDQTAGELRAALRKAVIAVDPDGAEQRRKAAVKGRRVSRYAREDGTSALEAVLSAIDTGEIYDLIDEVARRTKTTGDTRSFDARRADAFVWLMLGRDPQLGPEDPSPCPDDPPSDSEERPDDRGSTASASTHPTGAADDDPGPDEPPDLDERFPTEPAAPSEGETNDSEHTQPADDHPGPHEPPAVDERFRTEPAASSDGATNASEHEPPVEATRGEPSDREREPSGAQRESGKTTPRQPCTDEQRQQREEEPNAAQAGNAKPGERAERQSRESQQKEARPREGQPRRDRASACARDQMGLGAASDRTADTRRPAPTAPTAGAPEGAQRGAGGLENPAPRGGRATNRPDVGSSTPSYDRQGADASRLDDYRAGVGPSKPDMATSPPHNDDEDDEPGWSQWPDAFECALRDAELNRFDQARDARTGRISELATLALSAMISRRPQRTRWVALNQVRRPNGSTVLIGELQGYGPITGAAAQHLLASGAARAPDAPSGREPTPEQADRHDAPDWLDRDVRARDGTCRFAGCRQTSDRGDLDHTIRFPTGKTVQTNLGGLCRRHHLVKHCGAWHASQDDAGRFTWTSAMTGRTYRTYPRGTTGEWRGATTLRKSRPPDDIPPRPSNSARGADL